MTGPGPNTWPSTDPTAIAIAIDPKTSAKRKPTTRPISACGVRSWKSVWLGMMKTMLATPCPIARPIASGRLSTIANRKMRRPHAA